MPKRRSTVDISAEMEVIRAELVDLSEKEGTDEEVAANIERSKTLLGEFEALETERADAADYEKRVEAVRAKALDVRNVEGGDGAGKYLGGKGPEVAVKVKPFEGNDVRTAPNAEVISRAMAVIDGERRVPLSDGNKAHLENLVHRSIDVQDPDAQFDGGYVARRMLMTENPVYRSAFQKYARFGHMAAFTHDEQRAVAEFQDFEVRRAGSEGTNSAGGFGVPVLIDPTIIITSGAADAPILRISRTEQITTNVWKGVSSAGMTWSYDAEASEVSDDMATLAQPTVTVYTARGFIPYSIEIQQDYPGFANEMGRLLDQGYTDLTAAQSVTGSGSSQPRGIFVAASANTNVQVVTTTDGSFGAPDVFKTWNALPERYRSRATWVMSVSVESAIRQFATNANSSAYFTVDLTADGLSRINGRPVIVTDYAPSFSGSVPGTTGLANVLVVGDFSNYLIAQRAGMSIEQVPIMLGSNRRPSGQRGIFAWARHGMDSVNDLGFRILQNQ